MSDLPTTLAPRPRTGNPTMELPLVTMQQQTLATSVENLVKESDQMQVDLRKLIGLCQDCYRDEDEKILEAVKADCRRFIDSILSRQLSYSTALTHLWSLHADWENDKARRDSDLCDSDRQQQNLQGQIDGLESELTSLNNRKDQVEQALHDREKDFKLAEQRLGDTQKASTKLEEQIHDFHVKVTRLDDREARLQSGIDSHNTREDHLSEKERKLDEDTRAKEKGHTALCAALDSLQPLTGLLAPLERTLEAIPQESKAIARAIAGRISGLEDQLKSERQVLSDASSSSEERLKNRTSVLTQEIGHLKDANNQQSTEVNNLKNDVRDLQLVNDTQSRTIGEEEESNEDLLQIVCTLQEEVNAAQLDIKALTKRFTDASQLSAQLSDQYEISATRLKKAEDERDGLKREVEDLKTSRDQEQTKTRELQELQTTTIDDTNAKQQRIDRLEQDAQQHTSRLEKLTAESRTALEKAGGGLKEEQDRAGQLECDKASLEKQVEQLRADCQEKTQQALHLQRVNDELIGTNSELTKDVQSKAIDFSACETRLAAAQGSLTTEKATISRLRNQRNDLQRELGVVTAGKEEVEKRNNELQEDVRHSETACRESSDLENSFIHELNSCFAWASIYHNEVDSLEAALTWLQGLADRMLAEKEIATEAYQLFLPGETIPNTSTNILNEVLRMATLFVVDHDKMWKKRDDYRERLANLEKDTGEKIAQLTKNLEGAMKENGSLKSQQSNWAKEVQEAKDKVQEVQEDTKKQLSLRDDKIQQLEKISAAQSGKAETLQKQIDEESLLHDKKVKEIRKCSVENSSLKKESHDLKMKLSRSEAQYQSAQTVITAAKNDDNGWKAKYDEAVWESAKLEEEHETSKQNVADANAEFQQTCRKLLQK
ncbi:MAG: hypothetical protein Q9169_005533, partial [Polycauliona sp. 2 TL-2023]